MKIGCFEKIPVLQNKLKKELSLSPFEKEILLEKARDGKKYDLILWDQNYFPSRLPFQSHIFLVPGSAKIFALPEKGLLLTGGMNREDPVSFSSIGEEEALLCLGREIFLREKSLFPFEMKVPFDRNFSLYKNMALGFARTLVTLFFTEEL